MKINNVYMIKGVIFDFDGTLVDSNKIKTNTFYEITKDIIGAEIVLNKILSSPSAGDRYSIFNTLNKELKLLHDVIIDTDKLSEKYTALCENKISYAPEINGASITLKELRSLGISIFISSATPEFTLKNIIKIRGWESFFDMVLGSPSSKLEHVQTILNENKFSKSDVVYVGDSEADKNASSLAGCKFVGIGKNLRRFESKPEFFFESLENFTLELGL